MNGAELGLKCPRVAGKKWHADFVIGGGGGSGKLMHAKWRERTA